MRAAIALLVLLLSPHGPAQDAPSIEIEMEATTIKANKELPKLLYIIPWKDTELAKATGERKILIPNLFGDFYQPVPPGTFEYEQDEPASPGSH